MLFGNKRNTGGQASALLAVLVALLGLLGQSLLLGKLGWVALLSRQGFVSEGVRAYVAAHNLRLGLIFYALAALVLLYLFIKWGPLVTEEKRPTWRWEMALLCAILLLGLLLRVYWLYDIPPGVHVDEAINGLNALGITVRGHHTVYFQNSDGREPLLPYLVAGSFRLFGISLFAFKLVPLVVGVLTIAIVYLLGKELFDPAVGLLAAFLLAVSKWHLVISRVTHEAVPVPLLSALIAYFLIRAFRSHRLWDFLFCGLFLGLGMYTYPAFRAVPLMVAAYAIGKLIFSKGKDLVGLATAAATSLAIFAPLGLYMKSHWPMFTQRMRVTSFYMDPNYNGDVLGTLWANTLKTLTMLYTDNIAVYYLSHDTVLDLLSVVFFTFGLLYCLWFWRQKENALLVLWFPFSLLPSILSHAVRLPHVLRAVALIPLAPVLVAVGIWYLVQTLLRGLKSALPIYAAGCLVVLLLPIAALNLNTYFRVYAHDPHVYNACNPVPNAAARAVNELSQDYQVFVMPLIAEHSSFRLLTYERSDHRWLNASNAVGLEGTLSKDVVCILSPFDVERHQDRLARLKRDYPQGIATEYESPHGGLLYITYLVRKEDIVNVPGLSGEEDWGRENVEAPILYTVSSPRQGLVGWYFHDHGEGAMWLDAPRMVRVDQRISPGDWVKANFTFSIIWRGQIDVPESGEYTFGTESGDGSWVYIDGQLVVDNGGRHAPRYVENEVLLEKGLHDIEVRYFFERDKPRMELYWMPPGRDREIVPPEVLRPFPG